MTTYELPRPADNVEAVRDAYGYTWNRDSHPYRYSAFWYGPEDRIYTWSQLLIERGPLTETEKRTR